MANMIDHAVHIIAEAGTTHEGSTNAVRQLISVAHAAGADSVKFQFINPLGLYLGKIRNNEQLEDNPEIAARTAQLIPADRWAEIAAHAHNIGIAFSASVFDSASLAMLEPFDPPYIKIASCDLNNPALIEAAVATGRCVLISTGMSTLGEIEQTVALLDRIGAKDVVLLHCVSAYPCPIDQANIGFIPVLQQAFGLPVGYSDHTETSHAAIAAITFGVRWIEKHMTLDRAAKGFDHAYAMEPAMLTQFIEDVRATEAALTSPREKIGETERLVMTQARRGLWAAHDLPPGHVLTPADILSVRPAGPLTPADLPTVLGRRLRHNIAASDPIRLEELE